MRYKPQFAGEIESERLAAFIKGLTSLTQDHGLVIGGCGCCGSPYIFELSKKEKEYEYAVFYVTGDEGQDLEWKSR